MEQEKKDKREAALADAKMYMANDWELSEETPEYFLLKRNENTWGAHILILVLTGWWTFGLINLIYYFTKIKKKKIVK